MVQGETPNDVEVCAWVRLSLGESYPSEDYRLTAAVKIAQLRDRAVEVAAFTGRRHTFDFLILSIKQIKIAQLRSCPRKIAPL